MQLQRFFIISLISALIVYYYYSPKISGSSDQYQPFEKGKIIKKLQTTVSKSNVDLHRVGLGCNCNLDMVVRGVELMNALQLNPVPRGASFDVISNLKEFQETFSYYFAAGSAAERFVSSAQEFKEIVNAGYSQEHAEYHPGGNAVLMANAFARIGSQPFLAGPVGNNLRKLLHKNIVVLEQDPELEGINHIHLDQKTFGVSCLLQPEFHSDEVHLIMEYSSGQSWKGGNDQELVTPRANRFIVSHDVSNSEMKGIDLLHQLVHTEQDSQVQLLVISGTHLLEPTTGEIRETILTKLENIMGEAKDKGIAIHLELASLANQELLLQILKRLVPRAHSIGLNEQELGEVFYVTGGLALSPKHFVKPSLTTAEQAIAHLFRWAINQRPDANGPPIFGRVHLHFLAYHMIALLTGGSYESNIKYFEGKEPASIKYFSKEKAPAAVAAGSLTTTALACGSLPERQMPLLPPADELSLRIDLMYGNSIPKNADSAFLERKKSEGGVDISFFTSPVLVCTNPIRTVGLGDAISATGLAFHFRKITSQP